jgi:hypothetical protein
MWYEMRAGANARMKTSDFVGTGAKGDDGHEFRRAF